MLPTDMRNLFQGPRLVLSLAGHQQSSHRNDEAVIALVGLNCEIPHQVHLRCSDEHGALIQVAPCTIWLVLNATIQPYIFYTSVAPHILLVALRQSFLLH